MLDYILDPSRGLISTTNILSSLQTLPQLHQELKTAFLTCPLTSGNYKYFFSDEDQQRNLPIRATHDKNILNLPMQNGNDLRKTLATQVTGNMANIQFSKDLSNFNSLRQQLGLNTQPIYSTDQMDLNQSFVNPNGRGAVGGDTTPMRMSLPGNSNHFNGNTNDSQIQQTNSYQRNPSVPSTQTAGNNPLAQKPTNNGHIYRPMFDFSNEQLPISNM